MANKKARKNKRKSPPAIGLIVSAWVDSGRLGAVLTCLEGSWEVELGGEKDLHNMCWACGHEGIRPERCHLLSSSNGGDDGDPLNFILMCSLCHRDQPDDLGYDVNLAWVKARPNCVNLAVNEAQRVSRSIAEACDALGVSLVDVNAFYDRDDWARLFLRMSKSSPHKSNKRANCLWGWVNDARPDRGI